MNAISKQKLKDEFLNLIQKEVSTFNQSVSTSDGDWIIKGFTDVAKNIYTISVDTKVISKIMELLIFPGICQFATHNGFKIILSKEQNSYPDITFVDANNHKYAVDIKSTYRKDKKSVNGMTLGAFTGYFRNRKSYRLDELKDITSVAKDFTFFIQEKYKIAIDRPGSGNTKNIGSLTNIEELINGKGPFSELGEEIFDDYWMLYLTKEMANSAELSAPFYSNLKQYKEFKHIK